MPGRSQRERRPPLGRRLFAFEAGPGLVENLLRVGGAGRICVSKSLLVAAGRSVVSEKALLGGEHCVFCYASCISAQNLSASGFINDILL